MKKFIALALVIGIASSALVRASEEEDLSQYVGTTAAEGFIATEADLAPTAPAAPNYSPKNYKDMASVVVVVNKAAKGKTAQKAYVYKDGVEFGVYTVSTGREKYETSTSGRKYVTTTPVGHFRPKYQTRIHHSKTWDADMEYVTFFVGGVALHATTPSHYARLGFRDSGGCVRFKKEEAKIVYDVIKAAGRGLVQSYDRNGKALTKKDGTPSQVMNYKTLIIVNNVAD